MDALDWRAPGSNRAHAAPSWSPIVETRPSDDIDPYRVTAVSPGAVTSASPRRDAFALALRPGIVPMRPLGLGDIYGGVVRAIRGNIGSTMGLAAGTTAAFLVPMTALAAWLSSLTNLNSSGFTVGTLAGYIPSVGSWLSSILLAGFMAYVIGQGVLGRRVTPTETLGKTMRRIGALLLATFLIVGSALAVGVGAVSVMFAIGAAGGSSDLGDAAVLLGVLVLLPVALVAVLVLQTYFSFTTPALVLEGLSAPRAIRRSWRLVGPPHRSGFWRVLGIRLLTSVVAGIIGQIIATPMSMIALVLVGLAMGEAIGPYYFVAITVLQGLVAMMTGILTTPFIAGVDAVLYIDARIRKEALDVQLLHAGQDGQPRWVGAAR